MTMTMTMTISGALISPQAGKLLLALYGRENAEQLEWFSEGFVVNLFASIQLCPSRAD